MKIIQEAVDLSRGLNFVPMNMRYRLPAQKEDVSVFLLSDSYEYDIEMIKNIPQPKVDYKNIIIPYRIVDKIGIKPFRYTPSMNEYNKKISYVNDKKLFPKLIPIKFPYPKVIKENIYIPISEIIPMITPYMRQYSKQYIQDNIFGLFKKIIGFFNYSKTKILMIDTRRYKIYKNIS